MGHSRRWHVGPRKPGGQVQDPSSGEHNAPLRHMQGWRQPRPQEPCGQLCLHCNPMGSKSSEGQGQGTVGYRHPGSLTCPPRQAVALSSDGVTAIRVGALAALPAAGTECPILGFRDEVDNGKGGTGEGGARNGGTEDGGTGDGGAGGGGTAFWCCRGTLTGQGWWQRGPCHPGVQLQTPLWALQVAPWAQSQLPLQPGPQVPSGHGVEQSGPCQPAEREGVGVGMGMGMDTHHSCCPLPPPPPQAVCPPSLQMQEPSMGEHATPCWQEQRSEQFSPKVSKGHREEQCSSWGEGKNAGAL